MSDNDQGAFAFPTKGEGYMTKIVNIRAPVEELVDNEHKRVCEQLGRPGLSRLDEYVARRERVFSQLDPKAVRALMHFVQRSSSYDREGRQRALERWVNGENLTPWTLHFLDFCNAFTEAAEYILSSQKVVANLSFAEFSSRLAGDGIDGAFHYGLRGMLFPAEVVVVDDVVTDDQVDFIRKGMEKAGLDPAPVLRRSEYLAHRESFSDYREIQWYRDSTSLEHNAKKWQDLLNNKIYQQVLLEGLRGVPPSLTAGLAGSLETAHLPDDKLKFLKLGWSAGGEGVFPTHDRAQVEQILERLAPHTPLFVQAAAFTPEQVAGGRVDEVSKKYITTSSFLIGLSTSEQEVIGTAHQGNAFPNLGFALEAHGVSDGVARRLYEKLARSGAPPETWGQIFGVDLLQAGSQAAFLEVNYRLTGYTAGLVAALRTGAVRGHTGKFQASSLESAAEQIERIAARKPGRVSLPSVVAPSSKGGYKVEYVALDGAT